MANNQHNIEISEIPKSFIDKIYSVLISYSTVLIKVPELDHLREDDPEYRENIIGSGTFVKIRKSYGILTAQHVTAVLKNKKPWSLGLTLSDTEQRPVFDQNTFQIFELAIPEESSLGPDLSFISLSPHDVSRIKAVKSFVNIEESRNMLLKDSPCSDLGIWNICGGIGERSNVENSKFGFSEVLNAFVLVGETRVMNEFTIGEFDYIDLMVEYKNHLDVPESFKGISGGGIWQVLVDESKDGVIFPKEYLFSGVIFYQSDREDDKRIIRGHGRSSIYEYAFELFIDKFSIS